MNDYFLLRWLIGNKRKHIRTHHDINPIYFNLARNFDLPKAEKMLRNVCHKYE